MRVLIKVTKYKPVLAGDDKVRLYLLEREELGWREENKKRSKHVLDRLLAYANNEVLMNLSGEGYVFAEAEVPGMKAFVGEGGFKGAETIILPLPQPVNKIRLMKTGEGERAETLHEYTPPGELWGYESSISVDPSIGYDLVIIDTPEGPRPIFPDELKIPARKTTTEKRARRTRRSRRVKKTRKKRKTARKRARRRK